MGEWIEDAAEPSGWRHIPGRPTPAVRHDVRIAIADTGDAVSRDAPDPTPDEITDPTHPDYVEPWTGER